MPAKETREEIYMCEREKRFDIFLVWWMDGMV